MSLTQKDRDDIRSIVKEVVAAEFDGYAKRVGPIVGDYADAAVERLRLSVVDGLRVAGSEFRTELKATKEAVSKAAAAGERELSKWISRVEGTLETLALRVEAIHALVEKVYKTQHVDIAQGAAIRESLDPGEKSAITEVPPATVDELALETKPDATTATEAE
jgi:hypothetical protein